MKNTMEQLNNIPFQSKTELDLRFIPKEESTIKEIPGHALGLPLFAWLFLWPLQNTSFLEPLESLGILSQ